MNRPPRWGVSSLDWQSHAIDEEADHPYGVYIARCGQGLFMGAALYDEPPPGGWMCLPCLRSTGSGSGRDAGGSGAGTGVRNPRHPDRPCDRG
ncbi:MAG: hypothetical protein ACRDRW_14200 [Pseudonocardiaceae bacterium]